LQNHKKDATLPPKAVQTIRHRFNIYASSYIASVVVCRGDGHRKLVTRFGVIRRI